MPYFHYKARDREGAAHEGRVEAGDRTAALRRLEQSGLTPVHIEEGTGTAPVPQTGKRLRLEHGLRRPARMNLHNLLLFTRELSDLLSSGMTLGRALHTLAAREGHAGRDRIVKTLREEIVQGAALSAALQAFPDTFSTLYVSMIQAGETGGMLPETLENLCAHYEQQQESREKILAAALYPMIVLTVGILTVVGMFVFIIPRFSQVFEELGGTMPASTRSLIVLSGFMVRYGWFLIGGTAAGWIAFRKAIRGPAGRFWWHRCQLRLPLIRSVTAAGAFARFARTLEALLRNGVPVLQALRIVENTVGNDVIAREVAAARDRVTDGSTISGPLAAGAVFPRLLTDMLAVGEETGDLPGALRHISRRYQNQLNQSIKLMTTVLEPLLILGVAVLVGYVAVSLLMAVFDLSGGLQT